MSERTQVEKPFLDQLAALGWEVIDHGECLPTNPASSHRSDFKEVALRSIFKQAINALNMDEAGNPWLTSGQLDWVFDFVTDQKGLLVEANEAVHKLLLAGIPDVEDKRTPGAPSRTVRLIAFDKPEKNHFLAINQFRINTPGQVKEHIRPDMVLFVNGLPLVVIEAKEANAFTSIPLEEAIEQLFRYSERRDESTKAGVKEGVERLFHLNLFSVATTGNEALYGSVTTDQEEFQPWRSIEPPEFQKFKTPLGGPVRAQETLIQGMLAKPTLIDLLKNFVIFQTKGEHRVKVVCRYQQYRAVLKAIRRIRTGDGLGRGGVIWHTQGSGKSLTMVFFVRKLRSSNDLQDFKVLMVNDRTDLEEQLEGTAADTDEPVTTIENAKELKEKLSKSDSNLYLVMVHKFREKSEELSDAIKSALGIPVAAPRLKPFPLVNISDRILIFIDEAHRTQYSDLGNNLAVAFPNSIKIAFTGTPLITSRHDQTTIQRFGSYIDTYKLQDAQEDGAVLPIVYIGMTADTAITNKAEFDKKFDDLFATKTPEEINAIKAKYGTRDDLLEAEERIKEVAKDMVKHYIENIMPDGFKAQVVSVSKRAALRYKTAIDAALLDYIAAAEKDGIPADVLKLMRFLKVAVVVSSDGTNTDADIELARKAAKEMDAISNFKKRFDYKSPETGIAFLIVCDMLLTGFDAPIEQVMYLDKPLREHTLLQAIARVNRTARGKKVGFIVDYIGLTKHLREALSIYASDDVDDILKGLHSMAGEFEKLDGTYSRLLHFFREHNLPQAEEWGLQKLSDEDEYIVYELMMDVLEDAKQRETFWVLLNLFLQAINTVLPDPAANKYLTSAKRFSWLKAQARERFKDSSMSFGKAGEKIKKLINEHLISLGVNPKVPPVDLMSAKFMQTPKEAKKKEDASDKATASEMAHALRKHITVHMDEDPALFGPLSEKLEGILQKFQKDWTEQAKQMQLLVTEVKEGRKKKVVEGVTEKAAPFYDLLVALVEKSVKLQSPEKESLKSLVNDLIPVFKEDLAIPEFWSNTTRVTALKGVVEDRMIDTGVLVVIERGSELAQDLVQLAKSRHNDLLAT